MNKTQYPKLCNWILLKQLKDGRFRAKNCISGETYLLGKEIGRLARSLDGETDPLSVFPDCPSELVEKMMEQLEEAEFLHSTVKKLGPGSVLYTLVTMKKIRRRSRIAAALNRLLMLLWLPVLGLGLCCFLTVLPDLWGGSLALGQLMGVLVGTILHEVAGHALSAFAYRARVFEVGAMFLHFLPGAYVLLDDSPVRKRWERVQIVAAGVEVNFLLTGVGLILCSFVPSQSAFFFGFSLMNVLLGVVNLGLLDGMDGLSVMSRLLGREDWIDRAKYTFTHPKEIRTLLEAGAQGLVELTACAVILLLQLGMPMLYILAVLEVIEWFR